MPAIAWWPGKVKAHAVNSNAVAMVDLLPTVARLTGAKVPADRMLDGRDLSATLLKGESLEDRLICFYRGTRLFAVRKGAWKLHLLTQKGYGQPAPEAHDPPLLYNLNIDPGESFNVATNHPGVIAGLMKDIETHRTTVVPVPTQLEDVLPPVESPVGR